MKVYKVLIITIIVLFIILGIRIHTSNTKQEYSLQDIKKILNKADRLENYECEIDYGQYAYYKKKNNKIFLESQNGLKDYKDYDRNIEIICNINEKGKFYIEKNLTLEKIPSSNLYTGTVAAEELSSTVTEIISVKQKEYNGMTCLKAELKDKRERVAVFWIDIDTGLIMKAEFSDGTIKEYKYKFDTVTESDVTPNLSGYTKVKPDF